jgi:hypothetical protein
MKENVRENGDIKIADAQKTISRQNSRDLTSIFDPKSAYQDTIISRKHFSKND